MPDAGCRAAGDLDARAFLDRHYRAGLAAVCLLGFALTIAFSWAGIVGFKFTDPDDIMRLLEVRAWLNGQSWFDVSQYRLNPPTGYAMHWSRLVDVPLAAIILAAKPWVGQRAAETLACAIVPILTLGTVTLLVSGISRRLYGSSAALLAALFCFLNAGTFSAIWPMRIDHHGWEAAGGLAIIFFLTRRRDAHSAAIAGLCAACWTHISLEGIAFTAGTAAWLGARWLFTPDAESGRLPAFLGTLAGSSLLLFLATHRLALLGQTYCDAISPVHIIVFASAALLTAAAVTARPRSLPLRILALACAAAACGAFYVVWAPQCTKGPFASLTPLVYNIWFRNVSEALPVWHNGLAAAAFWVISPLIGLIGAAIAFRAAGGTVERARLIDYFGLLALATAIGMLILRASIFANLLAIPGQTALILILLDRVEGWPAIGRLPARALAVLLLSPMGPQFLLEHLTHSQATTTMAEPASEGCTDVDNFRALDALPQATFMTPFDIAPALIAGSHHDAVGSGYHRNTAAMEDMLRFFGSPDADAHAIVLRHGARYFAFCAGDNLISFMGRLYPAGLAAHLHQGNMPPWLHPVTVPGTKGLRVYAIDR